MASRYPSIKVVDYCFHPIRVVDDDGKDIIVPCGKCDGCLLHNANKWSMRCGMEIESTPVTIFGTLTYTNKYLPRLFQSVTGYLLTVSDTDIMGFPRKFPCDLQLDYKVVWSSDVPTNIRFNGVRDVPREDGIIINFPYPSINVKNWNNKLYPVIAYPSKRDIQLWLKLLRKDLDENLYFRSSRVKERGYFRYYIVAEIGPTTLRPHYHFLIFCQSNEVAQYLLECSLYKNWKMCSEDRFFPYCHICDSGARGYVTQYLTCSSDLPKVFRNNKEIKPFRLASKSPAIGYIQFDKEKVCGDVAKGIINYSREVSRLGFDTLLEYPSDYLVSIFPKCYKYASLDDSRRFAIYSYLYRAVRKNGLSYFVLLSRLSAVMQASDYMATRACYRFCQEVVDSPEFYYYCLDTYFYKVAMSRLKSFYEAQENEDFVAHPYLVFSYYSNLEVWFNDTDKLSKTRIDVLCSFFSPLGIDFFMLLGDRDLFYKLKVEFENSTANYRKEVEDICDGMVKVAKFNEMTNNSPCV